MKPSGPAPRMLINPQQVGEAEAGLAFTIAFLTLLQAAVLGHAFSKLVLHCRDLGTGVRLNSPWNPEYSSQPFPSSAPGQILSHFPNFLKTLNF